MNVSCLKYVTHMDEACFTCECVVMSHMCHTHGWVMSMCECVMSHICLTYGWVMSHVWMCHVSRMSRTWMSHVSRVNTSYLAYERVIWLISKLSLVTLKKFTVQSLLQGSFAKETYIYWDPTGGEGCNDIISYLTYERVIWLVWLISQVLSPSNISHTHTHTYTHTTGLEAWNAPTITPKTLWGSSRHIFTHTYIHTTGWEAWNAMTITPKTFMRLMTQMRMGNTWISHVAHTEKSCHTCYVTHG